MKYDQTTPAPVEVTQADRDVAAEFGPTYYTPHEIRLGHRDYAPIVQAFARHRLAALADAQVEAAQPVGPREELAVAWMYDTYDRVDGCIHGLTRKRMSAEERKGGCWTETPLYTHPPAQDVAALVDDLDMACGLIQEAKGMADGPDGGDVTNNLDAAENWIDKVRTALAKHERTERE